jgi:hypothetical protein
MLVVIVLLEVAFEMEKNDDNDECALIIVISPMEASPKI